MENGMYQDTGKKPEPALERHIGSLIGRYPVLEEIRKEIVQAYFVMEASYADGGKLLTAGNGGSAADAGHIVAELMKRFRLPRPLRPEIAMGLRDADPEWGVYLAERLEQPLPAVSLDGSGPLATAYGNDVGWDGIFAQQMLGLGNAGDVFLGISVSGASKNVINAAVTAKALGISVIALTGADGGGLARVAQTAVRVPADETYRVQELHLPIYHCWCAMLEERFFGKAYRSNDAEI